MSKHLKKGCPLPISIIAKKRKQFLDQARRMFYDFQIEGVNHIFIRNTVTQRTILYMDKFRSQKPLALFLKGVEKE